MKHCTTLKVLAIDTELFELEKNKCQHCKNLRSIQRCFCLLLMVINFQIQSGNFLYLLSLLLEPIVEIQANIKISIASWFKGTPVPTICIVDQNVLKQAKLHVSKVNSNGSVP